MTLQYLAAVAAVVHLLVLVSACAVGFLLARGTRIPGWAAAGAMLLIIRAISMATAHVWATPSSTTTFPIIDVVVGALAATCLTLERRHARATRTPAGVSTIDAAAPVAATEAHADAA